MHERRSTDGRRKREKCLHMLRHPRASWLLAWHIEPGAAASLVSFPPTSLPALPVPSDKHFRTEKLNLRDAGSRASRALVNQNNLISTSPLLSAGCQHYSGCCFASHLVPAGDSQSGTVPARPCTPALISTGTGRYAAPCRFGQTITRRS